MSLDIPRSDEQYLWSKTNSIEHEKYLEGFSACQLNGLPEFLQSIISELLELHLSDLNASFVKKGAHPRQIAIYLSNVGLGISMRQLAKVFNLNRSTIAYACKCVEDRRDDPAYDRFLIVTERIAQLAAARYRTV